MPLTQNPRPCPTQLAVAHADVAAANKAAAMAHSRASAAAAAAAAVRLLLPRVPTPLPLLLPRAGPLLSSLRGLALPVSTFRSGGRQTSRMTLTRRAESLAFSPVVACVSMDDGACNRPSFSCVLQGGVVPLAKARRLEMALEAANRQIFGADSA